MTRAAYQAMLEKSLTEVLQTADTTDTIGFVPECTEDPLFLSNLMIPMKNLGALYRSCRDDV